ncbi:hypothetical protein AWU66_14365 [Leptospira interrogans serovar Pomona]|nr:hypothetical protein AWU66_14365 [Leptospira interrogans serovar Pomona]OQN94131.1 hypothetical protein AR690_04930 [Leptospira interrogans serovar Lai]
MIYKFPEYLNCKSSHIFVKINCLVFMVARHLANTRKQKNKFYGKHARNSGAECHPAFAGFLRAILSKSSLIYKIKIF